MAQAIKSAWRALNPELAHCPPQPAPTPTLSATAAPPPAPAAAASPPHSALLHPTSTSPTPAAPQPSSTDTAGTSSDPIPPLPPGSSAPAAATPAAAAPAAAKQPAVKVRLVCTGALSNAALLLAVYPELVPMLEVVMMGGSMGTGNTGPMQEFNCQVDPEAAKMVFDCGVALVMVPLDVTHTVLVTPSVLQRVRSEGLPSPPTPQHLPHPNPPLDSLASGMQQPGSAQTGALVKAGVGAGAAFGEGVVPGARAGVEAAKAKAGVGTRAGTGSMAEPVGQGPGLGPGAAAEVLDEVEAGEVTHQTGPSWEHGAAAGSSPVQAGLDSAGGGLLRGVCPPPTLCPSTPPTTPFRHAVEQLLLFFQDTYRSVFGFIHPPLHDPCAVAFVIAPHLFKVRELRVDIETVSPYTAGQTVCDVWRQTGRPANCRVAVTMDVAQFWDLQLAALAEADVASPLNMLTIPKGG
ncbi:hypothetical protein QJQ45_006549 [Haematococcus lacustris]|nr:hypothetical protein QJQ45_006549 [Haematococcus lacustris]